VVAKFRENGLKLSFKNKGFGRGNPDILKTHDVDIIIIDVTAKF
jgi:hypothetical protein